MSLAFLMFSAVALMGVNPRMDIQTTMIAQLYFIPSFALLAVLIGVGLVIMLDGLGHRRIWKDVDGALRRPAVDRGD